MMQRFMPSLANFLSCAKAPEQEQPSKIDDKVQSIKVPEGIKSAPAVAVVLEKRHKNHLSETPINKMPSYGLQTLLQECDFMDT